MDALVLSRWALGNWWAYDRSTPLRDVVELLACARDHGVRLLDTAALYQDGQAEEQLGRALELFAPGTFLVATKGGALADGSVRLDRATLERAVASSLRRLRCDVLDLFQVHHVDASTPIGETLDALADLVRRGLVRAYGCCNYGPLELFEAEAAADAGATPTFATVQVRYNVLERQRGDVMFPVAERVGAKVLAYSALAEGLLAGRYRDGVAPGSRASRDPELAGKWLVSPWVERAASFVDAATVAGADPADLALGFVARDPRVATVVLGARTPTQLERAVTSLDRFQEPALEHALDAMARTRDALGSEPRKVDAA